MHLHSMQEKEGVRREYPPTTGQPEYEQLPQQEQSSFDREAEAMREQESMRVKEDEHILTEAIEGMRRTLGVSKKKKKKDLPIVRDEITLHVEQIMEDGLRDAFVQLSPIEQQTFKIKGEETAREIRQLLKSSRVKVKKIFQLLIEWLKLLPGVNRFFLEQEAKIKTDKILSLKERYPRR